MQLVGLVLAIAALIGIFGIISFILEVTLISLPVWGGAALTALLTLSLNQKHQAQELTSQRTMAKLVNIQFDSMKLNWSLDESKVRAYTNTERDAFLPAITGSVSALIMLTVLYKGAAFQRVLFFDNKVSPDVIIVISCILSVIALSITIAKYKHKATFDNSIREHVYNMVSRLNKSLEGTEELRSLDASIRSLSLQLKVPFPGDFHTEIQSFVNAHKTELLSDTAGLNKLIAEKIRLAQEDKIQLEKANSLYQDAMRLYTATAREVNKSACIPLIKELEFIYGGILSENLKSTITSRRWHDYHNTLNSIVEDIHRLNELAVKYQKEGCQEETESYYRETNEEKAYRILGIPRAATNDQIKKAYRTLVSIWHPDAKTVTDDTRIKEIIWAYALLKTIRQFV